MSIQHLPQWMQAIPVLIGVGLSIGGMYLFPLVGLRNVLGPIIGLPAGMVIGFGILAIIAKSRDA
jgi:hypothetical protein